MITTIRIHSDHPDFIALVKLLDADLAIRDGEDHDFYAQFNKIDTIKQVVLAYENEKPVGCGAIKPFDQNTMEIKRMYVLPGHRKKGIATKILTELENWTRELSCTACILETGKKQPEAIALYEMNGFRRIPNYGQYVGVENSLCFGKKV